MQVNERHAGFLVMVGMPGTGKTRLACHILYHVERCENPYVTQGAMLLEHRKTYGRRVHYRAGRDDDGHEKEPETIWEQAQKAHMLILDEIAAQPVPLNEMILFNQVLKYRYPSQTHHFDFEPPTIGLG